MKRTFILISAVTFLLTFAFNAFAGDTVTGRLIDALHDKGVISDSEKADISATIESSGEDAAAKKLAGYLRDKGVIDDRAYVQITGEKVDTAGLTEPKSSERTVRGKKIDTLEVALSRIEKGFARVSGGTATMKLSFFFQGGWLNDSAGFSYAAAPTGQYSATASNQFFMRRARIYLYGNVLDYLGYKVSFETASSSILRDAYVYLEYNPALRFTVGQFKVPFGMEGPAALASHPLVDRSMATNFMHAPTLRDQGVMFSGKIHNEYVDGFGYPGPSFEHYIMVLNGNGFNKADDNDYKDIAVRLRFAPYPGMWVGGSYYAGKTHNAPAGVAAFDTYRERWGLELDFQPHFAHGLKLQAEYLHDNRYFTNYTVKNVNSTAAPLPVLGRHAKAYGWYALLSYRPAFFEGGLSFLNALEPVVRYEYLDEDTAMSDDERYRTTLGINYYFAKQTRLMINYEIIHADGKLRAASLMHTDTLSHDILTTMIQLKF